MDPEAGRTIEVAALSRPFGLGMLYDCRRDLLVPGVTLWDCDDLEKHTRERLQLNSDFEIVASESLEDKSSALNVEASLKASFMSGLVEVEGSAKYLNDQRTSSNQARVTLKYKTTTKFQELSMKHLGRGNVKHPDVFDKGVATHVVTGILYGAQAFFVFDREVSQKENHQDIQGNLRVMLKKIPTLSIEGQGSLKMEDTEKMNTDKFSCKFHGDFCLQNNPTSFQDAIEAYRSLPKLLGENGKNAVPVKVWLYPLSSLDSAAAKLVRQISVRLVQEAQSVLEDFGELEIRYNDAMRSATAQRFPQICKNLRSFKVMCSEFKLEFQRTLARKLPLIRGGGEEESQLAAILNQRHSSPFNSKNLTEWMDCKEREIGVLNSFTNMMKNTKVVSKNGLHEEVCNAEHVLCFVFTSLGGAEPYLSALSDHLKRASEPGDQNPHTRDLEGEQWYLADKVAERMRTKAKLFSDFADANREQQNMRFLTAGIWNDTHKGSTIYLYKDGFPVCEDFEPPSKPEALTPADVNHDSVTLRISPPRFGAENVTSYCVEYRISGEETWQQKTEPKAEEVSVTGLVPNTEYVVRCRAAASVGVGPANNISESIKTLPCSPPGELQVESNSCEISAKWEKPTALGRDVAILSYTVEYAKKPKGEEVADLQWRQMTATGEKAVISGLHAETEYAVRVACDCGVDGRSNAGVAVTISTTKREFERLPEYLKHIGKMTKSSSPPVYKLPMEEEDLDIDGCRRFSFGRESMRQNRTIMLLGATGSGKSTLINGMLNFVVGVEWQDGFRFEVVTEDQSKSQAHSQTTEVTVYKINHQDGFRIPFSLTIVDTPGFGDTRGVARDKEITEQIRKLFTSANGVSEIDALCFVTQAALARLTATQKYVFDSVLSIFGKDVAENIEMLVTFADGKQPPVLEAINVSSVPCPKNELGLPVHFKFNNSALFASNTCNEEDSEDEDSGFGEMFWRMGAKSMEKFFTALDQMNTKSLLMTKEVLKERKQLETAIEGLQPQVRAGLAQLEKIKSTKEKIKEHETVMTSNENFQIEVEVIKPVQKQLTKAGEYITNCQRCSITCHYPCGIKKDHEKRRCASMDDNGMCKVCPGKCVWNVHFNQTYKWEYVPVKEKQTLQDLKSKYERATEEKMTVQQLIERQEEEILNLQDLVVSLMEQSASCISRLQEIALRPNPLSTPEYIDMMIDGEMAEAKPGYQARVQSLEAMKERAKLISKVSQGDRLAKTDDELLAERQQKTAKKTLLKKFCNLFNF